MAPARCPKSFAPRAGLPQKAVHAALICGSRDPRRMAPARCLSKLRPEVGPPTKSSERHPHLWKPRPAANGASPVPEKASAQGRASHKKQRCTPLTLWEPRPAANGASSVPEKASPRGRASHKNAVHAALICGSRDPRRTAPARCPKKLRPGSGLPQKSSAHRSALGNQGIGMSLASQDS